MDLSFAKPMINPRFPASRLFDIASSPPNIQLSCV
jgi:hypothetical protein